MAITDFIQSVLSGLGTAAGAVGRGIQAAAPYAQNFAENVAPLFDTRNWSQNALRISQMRQQAQEAQQRADALSQQSDLEERKFAAQQQYQQNLINDAKARTQMEAIKQGLFPADQQGIQGGSGLYGGNAESQIGAGGGNNMPTQSPGPNNVMALGPYYAFMNGGGGQQQSGGFGVNQPNQGPAGQPPANRVLTPTAYSGDGGGPAAPKPVVPTVFTLANGLKVTIPQGVNPNDGTVAVANLPKEMQPFFAGRDRADAKEVQQMAAAMKDLGIQVGGAKEKPESIPNQQENTAAYDVAAAHKLDNANSIKAIADLPRELQDEAWNKTAELKATETDKQLKAANLAKQQEETQRLKDLRASDNEVMRDVIDHPQAFFDKALDKSQKSRVRKMMDDAGYQVPVNELDQKQKDLLTAADVIQGNLSRMKQIAAELGPNDFGVMVGKIKNAAGDWGSTAFTPNSKQGRLEQEFRGLSKLLTAYETQLFGGGRAAVMMYNTVKSVTPNQGMDVPALLGSFDSVMDRAQQQKASIRRYEYGLTDNPYSQTGGHYPGEPVYVKGQPMIIKRVDPKSGHYFGEPVQ